ncbi:hypothetical protein F5Y18DRAFT_417262 [Xylariaceae sp. FL1019]|nr:hypothetical protein F5Y18DRAFT_417262 [Xylariaceae sp. FL1019]
MDDPWDWDVDKVVLELCTPEKPWYTSVNPAKLPPFEQLKLSLCEHEVDGEVLLTYEEAELCVDLGLKSIKHKSVFRNAISELRRQSSQYRIWRKRQASEFEDDLDDIPGGIKQDPQHDVSSKLAARGSVPVAQAATTLPGLEDPLTIDTPQPKKRRIMPTIITSQIDPDRNRTIITEADVIPSGQKVTHSMSESSLDDNLSSLAYLGDESVVRFDIYDSSTDTLSEPLTVEEKQVNHMSSHCLLPGRLHQAHRLVKRHLLRRNHYVRSSRAKRDMVPGMTHPDHDEVLPAYGDSDDELEYDSVTWAEIEAEMRDQTQQREKAHARKGLTAEEITDIVQRKMDQLAADWRLTKLPKHAYKANRIWNDARRSDLKAALDVVRTEIQEFNVRIAKLKSQYQKGEWSNAVELESKLINLEPSIHDKEHRSWLLGVLKSPTEPLKIQRTRKAGIKITKPAPAFNLAEGEEVLTSESEDDLGDFVIDDADDHPATEFDNIESRMELDDEGPERSEEPSHSEPSDIDMLSSDGGDGQIESLKDDERMLDKARPSSNPATTPNRTRVKFIPKASPKTPSQHRVTEIIDLTTPEIATHQLSCKDRIIRLSKTPSPDGQGSVHANSTTQTPSKKNYGDTKISLEDSLIMGIEDLTTAEQKVVRAISNYDQMYIDAIFSIVSQTRSDDVWYDLVSDALEQNFFKGPYDTDHKKNMLLGYTFIRLFEIYQRDAHIKNSKFYNLSPGERRELQGLYSSHSSEWKYFIRLLRRLRDRFRWVSKQMRSKKDHRSATSTSDTGTKKTNTDDVSMGSDGDSSNDIGNSSDEPPLSSVKRKKKRKQVKRDQKAAEHRAHDQADAAEQEKRRKVLRARMDAGGNEAVGSQQEGIIINETKADDENFVYIHPWIADRIKEHQVTGVRFMWDQVINSKTRQGCLLAHTMGLGKTMQIITLLVAIYQAAASSDPTISSQIPEELQESKTLIICPPTLVNNWYDELIFWCPEDQQDNVGTIRKVDSLLTQSLRMSRIRSWNEEGGVLLIGYHLYQKSIDEGEDMRDILVNGPNIVVADEAHYMKNPSSKIHEATANFRTLTRLALTGSPLANNVEEYFSMINWVAPNYLGDIKEFRAAYANPIKEGLSIDSGHYERRKALRMLRVLKSEVSPKVSRITISVLKNDIPNKEEFVISVPLTPLQKELYELYIGYHQKVGSHVPVFATHDLGLICAHPLIFLSKLQEAKEQSTGAKKKTEELMTLPQALVGEAMRIIQQALRSTNADEDAMSWKIPLLLEILTQCKKRREKVLIFSHSKPTLNYLEKILRQRKLAILRLDGDTPMGDRQNLVKGFNHEGEDVFIISTRAGGLGLNITGANRVIIFDSQFNPQNEQQAVGRAYRIGQIKPVFVYRFCCGGTFEQKMLTQAIWKMQLASRVVDKKHPIPKAQRFDGAHTMPEDPPQQDLTHHVGKDGVLDYLLDNAEYREGIRSLEMMDTFEEEAIEEAEMSVEDRAEADRIIKENEARRLGIPLSASVIAASGLPVPTPDPSLEHPGNLTMANFNLRSPTSHSLPQPIPYHPSGPSTLNPGTLSRSAVSSSVPQAGTSVPPAISVQDPQVTPPPISVPLTPPGLPVQLPGSPKMQYRQLSSSTPRDAGTGMEKFASFQGELRRLFIHNATNFGDEKTRANIAHDLSTVVWGCANQRPAEEQGAVKWAVIDAASKPRFVEAICMRLVNLEALGRMSPDDIVKKRDTWQQIDDAEWEAKKGAWSQEKDSSDPKHLQQALQRMTSTPSRAASGQSRSGSHRLDDQEALRAVQEARTSRTKSIGDQGALQAMMGRKNKKPAQPSDHAARPLPKWAKNAVLAKSPTPSSSTPVPKTSKSSDTGTTARAPQAKTPFK